MQFLETLFYFVITLGVLVFVHEFGHFIAAKLCRMRVDRFSIGFPPRAFGKKIGDTDYCVSWIPIGGYVKIAGMIDESLDAESLNRPPEPWEFRAKPVWQRMVVISAGVIMNLLLAVLIFWGINYSQGRLVRETTEIGYVVENSAAAQAGLTAGDRVLQVNGRLIANWDQILTEVYVETMGSDITLTVLRNGNTVTVVLPRSSIPDPTPSAFGIIPVHTEVVVTGVEPGMPADKLGLKPQDVLLSLDGTPLQYDQRVREIVTSHAGQPLQVEWKRGDRTLNGTVIPTDKGLIGISFGGRYTGPVTKVHYSLLEAFPPAVNDIRHVSVLFLQQMWLTVTGKTPFSESIGGPIRIAQMATQYADLGILTYLGFMALLSISLAFLNMLPVPALDGGHLVFLLYEGIFRREIPTNIKLGIQKVGMFLLLLFMAFVVYNDIVHF